MKILLINTVPTDRNGITGVLFNYLKAMNTEGMILDLLAINEPSDNYKKIVEEKGGKVFVIPRLKGTLAYWSGLYSLVKRERYDEVHIHGNSHTVVLELTAIWFAGCKVRIVHAHTTQTNRPISHKLATPLFNMFYTHGLACGEAAGKWMFGNKKFTVLNNGVDTKKFAFNPAFRHELRESLGWENCKVIGHVGYFMELKNHKWIVEVFRELHKRDNTYRLLLIGDGELRPEIEKQIADCGLSDTVKFTGNIDNVNEYLNAMDIVLMPSLFEGLPLTLIEQQANGLKCVVADTITREADKTKSLTFLSLNAPVSSWADTILEILGEDNRDRLDHSHSNIKKIANCGYSIQEEARKLNAYYLNAAKGK